MRQVIPASNFNTAKVLPRARDLCCATKHGPAVAQSKQDGLVELDVCNTMTGRSNNVKWTMNLKSEKTYRSFDCAGLFSAFFFAVHLFS